MELECGKYLVANTNAGDTIRVKIVGCGGQLALVSPFTSKVWSYRFPKNVTVQEVDLFFRKYRKTYITSVESVEGADCVCF